MALPLLRARIKDKQKGRMVTQSKNVWNGFNEERINSIESN